MMDYCTQTGWGFDWIEPLGGDELLDPLDYEFRKLEREVDQRDHPEKYAQTIDVGTIAGAIRLRRQQLGAMGVG